MSMSKEVIKKFVEEDFKDHTILVICDNEHKFYHRSYGSPDIVWDWNNDRFLALESAEDVADQNKNSMQVTSVSLEEIQFLRAFIDVPTALEFVNKNYKEEDAKKKAKDTLQIVKPGQMGPRTLRRFGVDKNSINE